MVCLSSSFGLKYARPASVLFIMVSLTVFILLSLVSFKIKEAHADAEV
ncbi:MAG: hypothetical protein GX431_10715 [Bacteroidales bacterium]|jgi:ABC-type sulfate transport system permease component|nr:hypothetical protein [Bacteroidales bacterium]